MSRSVVMLFVMMTFIPFTSSISLGDWSVDAFHFMHCDAMQYFLISDKSVTDCVLCITNEQLFTNLFQMEHLFHIIHTMCHGVTRDVLTQHSSFRSSFLNPLMINSHSILRSCCTWPFCNCSAIATTCCQWLVSDLWELQLSNSSYRVYPICVSKVSWPRLCIHVITLVLSLFTPHPYYNGCITMNSKGLQRYKWLIWRHSITSPR